MKLEHGGITPTSKAMTPEQKCIQELGIISKQPNKHKYKISEDVSKIAPNLLNRKFNIKAPNQVWCGDVTYVWAGNKWLYLAAVMDPFARRIVGWACSDSPNSAITIL